MPTLIDACVLIDIMSEDPSWSDWSTREVERALEAGDAVINPLILAELAVGFADAAHLDEAFPERIYVREHLPFEAAFIAGQCFADYRRRGGTRRSPLPDFYIGAHALVHGYRLLTRDARRFRTYFPRVELIAP